jgi:hypothetical protein
MEIISAAKSGTPFDRPAASAKSGKAKGARPKKARGRK